MIVIGQITGQPQAGPHIEKRIMRRAANPAHCEMITSAIACVLAAASLVLAAPAYSQTPEVEPEMQACAQDDVASFAIRACTSMITSAKFNAKDMGRLYTWRGKAWLTEDDPAAAAADYTRALQIDPLNFNALKHRAMAYTKLGEHAKAVEDWSQLIADQPNNDEYYRFRGTSRLAAAQHSDALADFDKSLEINSGGIDAYIGRAAVYDALGDKAKARKEFERAIAAKPDYLAIYWERAIMAERWGEQSLAIKDYEMVLKINGVYSHARKALRRLGVEHPP
jgi:tetratricopeptide (TPR) repeat protein